eukprot:scaffold5878_cov47-Phaeocystis_antarctica.AAC.1
MYHVPAERGKDHHQGVMGRALTAECERCVVKGAGEPVALSRSRPVRSGGCSLVVGHRTFHASKQRPLFYEPHQTSGASRSLSRAISMYTRETA